MPPLPPTPTASDEATRRAMRGNRRINTKPERALRSELHARGFRFRKDYPVDTGHRTVRADVVFTRRRVIVFVDGCYWHGCPEHCRIPTRNADYWRAKIKRNQLRDERDDADLTTNGWTVVRVWEHVPTQDAVTIVAEALKARRPEPMFPPA